MLTINFVRDRRRELSKQEVTDRLWFRYSLMAAGVVMAVALVVVGVRLFLTFRVSQVMARQTQLKQSITSQQDVERSYVIFFQKLKILSELFDQKSNKQAAIQFFGTIFGPQVLIQEINYLAEDGILSFGLQADDVFVLEQVFATLNSPAVKEQFVDVSKSELRRQADGSYQITVTVQLRETKASPKPKTNTKSPESTEK